jgi:DNA-binding NarL/FixJ family response regulator
MKELERVVVSVLNHPKQAPYYCFTAQNINESDSGLEVNYEVPPIITFRQETVLNYIRSGLKSVEIAERMNLSIDAVNKHRQNMMVKNNCSMAELIERYSFWSHKQL